jgi:hypothetical protein
MIQSDIEHIPFAINPQQHLLHRDLFQFLRWTRVAWSRRRQDD